MKNPYNQDKDRKHFGRLMQYIEIDSTYQKYKQGIEPKNDVEMFGILHSTDIEWALNEIIKFKEELTNMNKKHASGYWYQFIIPRAIVNRQDTKIVRWLNFYWRVR